MAGASFVRGDHPTRARGGGSDVREREKNKKRKSADTKKVVKRLLFVCFQSNFVTFFRLISVLPVDCRVPPQILAWISVRGVVMYIGS